MLQNEQNLADSRFTFKLKNKTAFPLLKGLCCFSYMTRTHEEAMTFRGFISRSGGSLQAYKYVIDDWQLIRAYPKLDKD